MNEISQTKGKTPIASLTLVAFMYLPLMRSLLSKHTANNDDDGLMFPASIVFALFHLGYYLVYFVAMIALPLRLYRHRGASIAHGIAFYASIGVLVLFSALIWTW